MMEKLVEPIKMKTNQGTIVMVKHDMIKCLHTGKSINIGVTSDGRIFSFINTDIFPTEIEFHKSTLDAKASRLKELRGNLAVANFDKKYYLK